MNEYINILKHEQLGNSRIALVEKFYNYFKNSNKKINVLETGCNYTNRIGFTDSIAYLLKNILKGRITTIDINLTHINNCQEKFASLYDNIDYICGDSVKVLESLSDDFIKSIDLFILDSYDLFIFDHHGSANHHLKELLAIINRVNENCLIAIDDNFLPYTDIVWNWNNGTQEIFKTHDKIVGKGMYCDVYLKNLNWHRDDSILYQGENNVFLYKKNV